MKTYQKLTPLFTFIILITSLFSVFHISSFGNQVSGAGPTTFCGCAMDAASGERTCQGLCLSSVKGIPCGRNHKICNNAQKKAACDHAEYFYPNPGIDSTSAGYLCPTPGGTDPLLAEKGSWSEVFNSCFCSATDMVQTILNIAVYSIATISLIFLGVGGIKYITAKNNPEKINEAKETLLAALIGMMLVLFSVALIQLLNRQFNPQWGIDFLKIV